MSLISKPMPRRRWMPMRGATTRPVPIRSKRSRIMWRHFQGSYITSFALFMIVSKPARLCTIPSLGLGTKVICTLMHGLPVDLHRVFRFTEIAYRSHNL